jgi:hypothetical protein
MGLQTHDNHYLSDNIMGTITDTTSSDFSIMDIDTDSSESSISPFLEFYPGAAQTFGCAATFMDVFDADPHAPKRQQHPYYLFASREEWQLGPFLLCSDLRMSAIDKFLKLELVSIL